MNNYTNVTTDSVDKYYRDKTEELELQKKREKRVFEVSAESDILDFCTHIVRLKNKFKIRNMEIDCGRYIFFVKHWNLPSFLYYLASLEIMVKSKQKTIKKFLIFKIEVPAEQYIIRSSYNHSKKREETYICLGKKFNDSKIMIDEKLIKTIVSTLKKCFLESLDSKTIKVKELIK